MFAWVLACAPAVPGRVGEVPEAPIEDGEWLPGGDATSTLLLGSNAFLLPAPNLEPASEATFYSGNSFFNQSWIEAPASAASRDGLGPLFNAVSCSGCHFKDGRGAPPESGEAPLAGLLLRLSVPSADGPGPDEVYGGQLQDVALAGIPAEATPRITWTEVAGAFDDGAPYGLAAPSYALDDPAWGPFPVGLVVSPRVAPQMPGLGLLEAIPAAAIEALADPYDADGDGISGRIHLVRDLSADGHVLVIGRFGWKAEQPTVLQQSAGAFAGDLGITSRLFPADDCTPSQPECTGAPSGGEPELGDDLLDKVALYSAAVAVPVRRAWEDPDVRRGKWLFDAVGCASCHTPTHETGPSDALPEMGGQRIWPYTDLLLHDLGPDLADAGPSGDAHGAEWRTPPLWGLGLVPVVSGHSRYLHDGRARSLEEAILWHGGEAEEARDGYLGLDAAQREQVLAFVGDL